MQDLLEISYEPTSDGATRVGLKRDDKVVSQLYILPYTLRIGAATVRMDGIGGVWTEPAHRKHGYARQVLEAAIARMRQGDAALSMLYGIHDFYPKFGFTTAGPDHFLSLTELSADVPLPAGWRVRPFALEDLPAVQRLYEENTARAVGAAVRPPQNKTWARLAALAKGSAKDACRVVEDPGGNVVGYAWRGKTFWYVEHCERYWPGGLVIAEVAAASPAAADAVLTTCRAWAAEEIAGGASHIKRVDLALPREGRIAAAARYQAAEFVQRHTPCGGSMARVIDVARLLTALKPELEARLAAAHRPFSGSLRVETEIGAAAIDLDTAPIAPQGQERPQTRTTLTLKLPQMTLARLALGAFPPEDLLDRSEEPPEASLRPWIAALFPLRSPNMYLPDRF